MNAADTVKDVVRIATTAGLSKDVIDLLQAKADLLAEQNTTLEQENTTLLRENRNLHLVNADLKKQLENAHPKGDELDDGCKQMLIAIANFSGLITSEEIFRQLGFHAAQGQYWLDQLIERNFVDWGSFGTSQGSPISATPKGREFMKKMGFLTAKPDKPLREPPAPDPYGRRLF